MKNPFSPLPKIKLNTPNNPVIGEIAVDTSSGSTLKMYDGTGWQEINSPDLKSKEDMRREAQDYLTRLGIKVDIDTLLAEKYPEHLI